MIAALLIALAVLLQGNGGQVWVRAFADSDGDGVRDAGEALLRSGVVVEVVRDGVVIASASLDDSEYIEQGLIGFQGLPTGPITLRLNALDGTATTPISADLEIADSGLPPVIDFGVTPIVEAVPEQRGFLAGITSRNPELTRIGLASLGAVLVGGVTAGIGFIIYLLLRARKPKITGS
jgi:hypothetical protein